MPRPGPVTALGILCFVVAAYLLSAGIALLGNFVPLPALPAATGLALGLFGIVASCGGHFLQALPLLLQVPTKFIVAIYFALPVVYAVIGIGILKLKNWARLLLIALASIELLAAIVGYALPRFLVLRLYIVGIVIDILALMALFQPATKQAFGKRAS